MGKLWDLVRILMVELGYIKEMMGVDCVRVKQLRLFSEAFNGDVQIHISDTHLKGKKILFYVSREATIQCSP